MGIRIEIKGASKEELAYGVAAAAAVFASAGTSAEEVFSACSHRDALNPDIKTREIEIAWLWDEADFAAANACCAMWPERARAAGLQYVFDFS